MTRRSAPQNVGRAIDSLRLQFGLAPAGVVDALSAEWVELVGEQVASLSRPVEVRNGILLVDVADPASAQVVSWSTDAIAAFLAERGHPEPELRLRTRVVRGGWQ